MPDGLIQQLLDEASAEVLVMDGGMGSTIADRGMDVRNALWGSECLLNPRGRQINDQVHADFIRSGARILIANTHNVRLSKCEEVLKQLDAAELPADVAALESSERPSGLHHWLHDQAIASARRAIPHGAKIALASCLGSIEPLGPYAEESRITVDEACNRLTTEWHVRKDSDVDLIIFETLTTRSEIEGLARLGREQNLGNFAVGLTCGPDAKTLAGVSMADAVAILEPLKPLAYFVQCTRYDYVQGALRQLVAALGSNGTAGVYANDGRIWKDRRWHGERIEPQKYADEALAWKEIGARIIGGCCGIDPARVAVLSEAVAPHH